MLDRKRSRTTGEHRMEKPVGTILDERYVLQGVIGVGGFSVVYDALNLHNDQHVAIKECTAPEVREKFLKEARMLRDYSDEAAIVSVLDYFEDDDTAYIVMEYLEGHTLREYVNNNTLLTMEETVRLLSPLMEVLAKMHGDGIVHRDISPDNLMILEDGSLKLLDFGAAKEYRDKRVTKLIYKANYSPPELRDEEGNIGRWSDVYSMCATIYFCISGQDPEDVVSRLLLDELQPPSSLGIDILPPAEKILLLGMEPKPGDRLQDMGELRSGLETYYPVISEEEKLAHAKAKKRKRLLAIAGIAIIVLCLAGYINSHKLQVLFHAVDTETIFLDGSDFTDEEFRNSSRIVKKRVNAFSDGMFLWNEEEKKIRFEVPSKLFGKSDPSQYTRVALSRPMKMYFTTYDKKSDMYVPIEIIEQSKDIEAVAFSADSTSIIFTDKGQEKFKKYLTTKGNPIGFGLDLDMNNYGAYRAVTQGDGKTAVIDYTDTSYDIPDDLLRLHFTKDPSDKAFNVNRKWSIAWETPAASLIPGKKQAQIDHLTPESNKDEIICIRYKSSYSDSTDKQGYDSSFMSMQAIIRNRLDAFAIPYAMGKDPFDPKAIIVGFPNNNTLCQEMILGLGLYPSYAIGGEKAWLDLFYTSFSPHPEVSAQGVKLTVPDYTQENDLEKTKKQLLAMKRQGQSHLYMYFMGIPVVRTNLDEAIASFTNSGNVFFSDWCCEESQSGLLKGFTNFMKVSNEQSPEHMYEVADTQSLSNGELLSDEGDELPFLFRSETRAQNYINQWQKDADDRLTIRRDFVDDYSEPSRSVDIAFFYDKSHASTDTQAIQTFCDLYKSHKMEFNDGTFTSIIFNVFGTRDNLIPGAGGFYVPNTSEGTLVIQRDFESGKFFIKHLFTSNDSQRKAFVDYLEADPVFSEMITDESDIK